MVDKRKMGNYSRMSEIPKQCKNLYWMSLKIDYFKEHGDINGEMSPLFHRKTCGLNNHYILNFTKRARQ